MRRIHENPCHFSLERAPCESRKPVAPINRQVSARVITPLIVMMQPTYFWDFPDQSKLWSLDRPRHRTTHIQRPVRAPVMIILRVPSQEPSQMSLVQDDDMVQAVTADTPDEPFDIGVLPGTPG